MRLMLAVNERLDEQRRIVAYFDSFPLSRDLRQARLASLRELQSQTALVHKSKSRRNTSIGLIELGDFVTLGHTQVRHSIESGATD